MEIAIVHADIRQVLADLIVLKYADGFHGADAAVADTIGFREHIERGSARICRGMGITAQAVLYIGVGPLRDFRYERIQEFGSRAVTLARGQPGPTRHIALTVHGPGYGLDLEQAFLSLVAGIVSEWKREAGALQKVTIAERSEKRSALMEDILRNHVHEFGLKKTADSNRRVPTSDTVRTYIGFSQQHYSFWTTSGREAAPFRGKPFSADFIDEFEIGFCEAARANSFVCERLDLESYTGDVVAEMKRRILGCCGMIALLNTHNPNVFLEIGFALAHEKPTILVAKEDVTLPFDVRGHRCIKYRSIIQLRNSLAAEIASLKAAGILMRTA